MPLSSRLPARTPPQVLKDLIDFHKGKTTSFPDQDSQALRVQLEAALLRERALQERLVEHEALQQRVLEQERRIVEQDGVIATLVQLTAPVSIEGLVCDDALADASPAKRQSKRQRGRPVSEPLTGLPLKDESLHEAFARGWLESDKECKLDPSLPVAVDFASFFEPPETKLRLSLEEPPTPM